MSPAAYLVDLLRFIDRPNPVKKNPQDVLFSRRPDLKYLPLTCANTNVPLPYVDLVNETLEYYVGNQLSLANYQGHDTGATISSAELPAGPQYDNDSFAQAAYATLPATYFPPPLPFHRPLELLRSHFQKLGIPLADVMTALRSTDALERGTAVYGRRDILMEQIGFSRAEYRVLTDSTLALQDLYGYPSLAAAEAALPSVQNFSRRVGVAYDDIVSMLLTRFINPNSILIPRLERLSVSFATLQALKNGTITPAAPCLAAGSRICGRSMVSYRAHTSTSLRNLLYSMLLRPDTDRHHLGYKLLKCPGRVFRSCQSRVSSIRPHGFLTFGGDAWVSLCP